MNTYELNGTYTTADELAKAIGIRKQLVILFCSKSTFIGAVNVNGQWLIPLPLLSLDKINSERAKQKVLQFIKSSEVKK